MLKFKSLIGYVEKDSSYITIEIENGDNADNIGDQMWISPDGKLMEISDMADEHVYTETANLFGSQKNAFKGAMRRMGVTW